MTLLCFSLATIGCTSFGDYVRNGFKVGPNYGKPPVIVADQWIDANDARVRTDPADVSAWWCAFEDPILAKLVQLAYGQNLTVREAGFRILEARAQRAIAAGFLFPQLQQAFAGYSRNEISREIANRGTAAFPTRFYDIWDGGFNLAWELDFWGRFRRAIESADAVLDASVENYDDVLVTLVSDIASTYVTIRTLQKRIEVARANVANQKYLVDILEQRFKKGAQSAQFDYPQHKSQYEATKGFVWQLEIDLRHATNQLCILLSIPPQNVEALIGSGPIPFVPDPRDRREWNPEIVAGIPGELLLRRPDVRRAERELAAQCAQIGIATADLYPRIAVTGTIGVQSSQLADLFTSKAWYGNVGPSLVWNILNYGRLLNNIRAQDSRFQVLAAVYQKKILKANQEAEDGMVDFLKSQPRFHDLRDSALDAATANSRLKGAFEKGGDVNFNQWFNVARLKRFQDDQAAQAEGDIAQGLIQLYRALGGGWQIRLGAGCHPLAAPVAPKLAVVMVEGRAVANHPVNLPAAVFEAPAESFSEEE